MNTLAKNIRYLRREKSLSQEDIAKKLGYKSYTTIQKWESGDSQPPVSKIEILSKIFNVSVSDLLGTDLEAAEKEKHNFSNNEVPEIIAAHFKDDDIELSEKDLQSIENYISFLINKNKNS